MSVTDLRDAARAAYRAAHLRWKAVQLEDAALGPGHPLQKQFTDAILAAAPKAKRRRLVEAFAKSLPAFLKAATKATNPKTLSALSREYQAKAAAVIQKNKQAADEVERELSKLVGLHGASLLRPAAGDWRLLAESHASTWRSTSNGEQYARCDAELAGEGVKPYGVETKVVRVGSVNDKGRDEPDLCNYQLLVAVEDEIDVEILKRLPGLSTREWVRLCWGRGCQPRVFHAFLPVGFEEREGLDYFGRDLRKTTGGAPANQPASG